MVNRKPKPVHKERCYKCGSYGVVVVNNGGNAFLACSDCGAHIRDFGD